jgi:hypothetical protein
MLFFYSTEGKSQMTTAVYLSKPDVPLAIQAQEHNHGFFHWLMFEHFTNSELADLVGVPHHELPIFHDWGL